MEFFKVGVNEHVQNQSLISKVPHQAEVLQQRMNFLIQEIIKIKAFLL